ncbi:Ff.00g076860.m01.CDS01 [Fusarium sp. VM40]|nr:Ff.00g076860.m01.CDS01 [Fusarium sp. VM40]
MDTGQYQYKDDHSRQLQLCITSWVLTSLATSIVIAKLVTTVFVNKTPGWDDLMIFVAMIASLVTTSLIQVSINLGFGRPWMAVAAEVGGAQKFVQMVKLDTYGYHKAFTVIAYSLPNVAILILIERLAGRTKTFSRNFLRITVAIQIILAIASVICKYVQCRVIEALWQLSSDGECNNKIFNYTFYAANCFTIFTDIVLAIVPIHAFWKLQMGLQKKLEVTFLLGLTFLSAIFTTMKVYYIYKFFDAQDFGPGGVDLNYDVVPVITWATVEKDVIIIAACVPTLWPLLHVFKRKSPFPRAPGINHSGSTGQSSSSRGPKHCPSISEIPLDDLEAGASRRSEPSFEASSSLEDWDGRPTTGRYELG